MVLCDRELALKSDDIIFIVLFLKIWFQNLKELRSSIVFFQKRVHLHVILIIINLLILINLSLFISYTN